MKKISIVMIIVLAAGLLTAGTAPPAETATWSPNEPLVEIYKESMETGYFTIDYNHITTEQISITDAIHLLMIDGGFVPNPRIIIENDRVLVPIRLVSETLGAAVAWNENERLVTIRDGDTEILLRIDSEIATVNDAEMQLDTPATIVNASTYVPLRFVADSFGAAVDYIPQLTYDIDYAGLQPEDPMRARENVRLVIIEKGNPADNIFTVEDGLAAVQEASIQLYEDLLGYLKVDGDRDIKESGRGDYDPRAIAYAGYSFGRYYVYQLEGFKDYPIFFNKYTGEMFGESVGLPFIFWAKGFPRLSFMYQ